MSPNEQLPPNADPQAYPAAPPAPPAPEQGTSGLAIAGLILAFVAAPIGFILSIIGIAKTGKGKAKGRGLAVAGLVLSTLFIAGGVTAVIVAASSTQLDPGCTAGKDTLLANAENVDNEATLQTLITDLDAAAGKAKDDEVKATIQALSEDYKQLQQGMQTGNLPDNLVQKVTDDATKFDSLCTVGA